MRREVGLHMCGFETLVSHPTSITGLTEFLLQVWAPDQEVDQRGRGERLCKKIAKHVI